MVWRIAVLWVLLIAFAASPLAFPYDPASIPTRNPDTAVPLLKKFAQSDGYARIAKILGKADRHDGDTFYFGMDDYSEIRVSVFDDGRVFAIDQHDPRTGASKGIVYFAVVRN